MTLIARGRGENKSNFFFHSSPLSPKPPHLHIDLKEIICYWKKFQSELKGPFKVKALCYVRHLWYSKKILSFLLMLPRLGQARPGQARAISISFYGSYKNTFISSWRVLKALIMTFFCLWTFLEMEYII